MRRAFVALALLTSAAFAQDGAGFQVVRRIPISGQGTSWDYTLADAASHRLYVSHGTEAVVINTDNDSILGRISPTPGIHGIAVANELNRGCTSNGRDTSVTIFDLKTLATIAVVKVTGTNPDAIWYDDVSKREFTMNAAGSSSVIDAAKGTVVATIPLPGKPEFAQTDGKGLIFITTETDTGQIVVVDTKAAKEVKRYSLPGCASPTGLAIDRKNNRLISSCDEVMMPRSRTMGYDVRTHRAYLAAIEVGTAPAPDPNATGRGGRARGAPAVPGSFHVIVLERK